jgi:hypothetical protein
MTEERTIEFTQEIYDRFKAAYEEAAGETFMFDGIEVLKDYAKYVLMMLSPRFDKEAAEENEKIVTLDKVLYHDPGDVDVATGLVDFFIEGDTYRFGALQWGYKRELWSRDDLDEVKGDLAKIQELISSRSTFRGVTNPYARAFGVDV